MKKQDLIDIISSIKANFSQDELAYLALTSKVEHPLRDAIAYNMHVAYPNTLLVCRESLNRFDIAANNPTSFIPEILFEFKAHSSIDPPQDLFPRNSTTVKGGKNDMVDDISKMYQWAIKNKCNPDMYFVFFNNILDSTFIPPNPGSLNKSIKYCDKKRVLHHISKSYEDKVQEVFNNWETLLKDIFLCQGISLPIQLTSVAEIKAGQYYTIPVSVLAFIYGPFKKSDFRNPQGNSQDIDSLSNENPLEGKTLNVDDQITKFIFVHEDKRLDGIKLW